MKYRNVHVRFWTILAVMFAGLCVSACNPASTSELASDIAEDAQINTSTPITIGEIFTIASEVLDMDRRLSVRLPAEYESEPERAFPVVYVIDGGPEQDFPHIAGIAHSREMNFTFEPFILVGVETVNRYYQISPPARDMAAYAEVMGNEVGGSADFRQFLREDVMTWVNARYRSNGQSAVMGESLAGLFIVETLLKDPALFNDYIAVSPSLWWDEMQISKGAVAAFKNMPPAPRRLYLTMGDEGFMMQKGLDVLIAALEANAPDNLKWTYVDRRNSESHASIYHPAALDAFRSFYLTPGRTGGAFSAMYEDGVVPEITDAAKVSLKQPCDDEYAIRMSFSEKNKDMEKWMGHCVLMKPGDKASAGNLGD